MYTRSKRFTQRGQYIEHDPSYKDDCFNRPVVRYCTTYMKKHRSVRHQFYVMDAAKARTSRALRASGITDPITAFTNNRNDYTRIDCKRFGIRKCYRSANRLYGTMPYCHSVIVIHDGMCTAKYTWPDLELLISRRFPYLAIMANVSTRGKAGPSQYQFEDKMEEFAAKYGYLVYKSDTSVKGYDQGGGPMQPFWFEMRLPREYAQRSISPPR
jgi:hypothetical protein